jgi:succinate---hydroxymethylglutarate CoA-transferase
MLATARNADGTEIPMIGPAVKFASFDVAAGWTAPPKVGEHTDEVLGEWLDPEGAGSASLSAG